MTTTEPNAVEFAAAIATHLPPSWTAEPVRDGDGDPISGFARIVRASDGATVHVHVGGFRMDGRVKFVPVWPRFEDGSQHFPSDAPKAITCGVERDPKDIARELSRKLLAAYLPMHEKARALVKARAERDREAEASAARIAKAVGGHLSENRRSGRSTGCNVDVWADSRNVRGLKVSPGWDGEPPTVAFEVHDVDETTALELLAVLTRAASRVKVAS